MKKFQSYYFSFFSEVWNCVWGFWGDKRYEIVLDYRRENLIDENKKMDGQCLTFCNY